MWSPRGAVFNSIITIENRAQNRKERKAEKDRKKKMGSESLVHVLMISFPAQGHINPLLRLGKCLAAKGLFVTFSTTEAAGRDMRAANTNISDKNATPLGDGFLKFEFFDEGLEDDDPLRKNLLQHMAYLEPVGKKFISRMINKYAELNQPISCIINNPFFPWVVDAASEHGVPSALLWIQSAAVFAAYYHYHHKLVRFPSKDEPHIDVQLPSIVLKYNEIPDFLHPSSPFPFLGEVILGQFKNLSKPFCVLVDTFEELEHDYLSYLSKFLLIRSVGPLFKNPQAAAGGSKIRGDFIKSDDCIEWLNSKPSSSVVYISFGSLVYHPQEQIDEIAYGLVNSKVSFLWVLKLPPKDWDVKPHVLPDGFIEETRERGKVVQWSPQEEVLAHPSVACFVTHCGWNSSMEALSSGVPMLTFPAWGDQVTNAKFIVDVFGVGIRMGYSQAENKIVSRDEVKRCLLEATEGSKAEELKQNALKWKEAAQVAVSVGGSSDRNVDDFVEDIKKRVALGIKTNAPH